MPSCSLNFGELRYGEVRRIHLLGTSVNKGKKRKGQGVLAPAPPLLGPLRVPSHGGGGPYVLVDAEEVGWVVLVLYGDQLLEVVAVGGLHALLALVHHEVHVRPAARVGMHRVPVLLRPTDDTFIVIRVRVYANEDRRPLGLTVAEGRLVPAYAVDRPVYRVEVHRRVHRRHFRSVPQVHRDGLV